MKEQEYTVQFSAGETYGIITSKLPLARPRVCKAHAPVLAHRVLSIIMSRFTIIIFFFPIFG